MQLHGLRHRHLGKLRVLNNRPSYLRTCVYRQFRVVLKLVQKVLLQQKSDQHNSRIEHCMIQMFL
jgi:hypothetical protein